MAQSGRFPVGDAWQETPRSHNEVDRSEDPTAIALDEIVDSPDGDAHSSADADVPRPESHTQSTGDESVELDSYELNAQLMQFVTPSVEFRYQQSRTGAWAIAERVQLVVAFIYIGLFFIFALNGTFGDTVEQQEDYKKNVWVQGLAAGFLLCLLILSMRKVYPDWLYVNPRRRFLVFYGMVAAIGSMIIVPRAMVNDGTSSGGTMLLIMSTCACLELYINALMAVIVIVFTLLIQFVFLSDSDFSRVITAFLPIAVMAAYPMMALYQIDSQFRKRWLAQRTVDARRESLVRENDQMESLLRLQLPEPVIARLKVAAGRHTMAQRIHCVTVCFVDLEGWGDATRTLDPGVAVSALNELFSRFDEVVEDLNVEKIKTIGPVYMIAGNVPDALADHTAVVTKFGLVLLRTFADVRGGVIAAAPRMSIEFDANDEQATRAALATMFEEVKLKIGVNVGEVVAGIVGDLKFCYDIYGDTVNTASRMCKFGEVGRIQCTEAVRDALVKSPMAPLFSITSAGVKTFKGKGEMETFFVDENSEHPIGIADDPSDALHVPAAPALASVSVRAAAALPIPRSGEVIPSILDGGLISSKTLAGLANTTNATNHEPSKDGYEEYNATAEELVDAFPMREFRRAGPDSQHRRRRQSVAMSITLRRIAADMTPRSHADPSSPHGTSSQSKSTLGSGVVSASGTFVRPRRGSKPQESPLVPSGVSASTSTMDSPNGSSVRAVARRSEATTMSATDSRRGGSKGSSAEASRRSSGISGLDTDAAIHNMGSSAAVGGGLNLSRMDIDVLIDGGTAMDNESGPGSAWALAFTSASPTSSVRANNSEKNNNNNTNNNNNSGSTRKSATVRESVRESMRGRRSARDHLASDTMTSFLHKEEHMQAIEGLGGARMGKYTLRFNITELENAFRAEFTGQGRNSAIFYFLLNFAVLAVMAVIDLMGDEEPSRKASLLAVRFVVGAFVCFVPASLLHFGRQRLSPIAIEVIALGGTISCCGLMIALALANRSVYNSVYCTFGVLFLLVGGTLIALPIMQFYVSVIVGISTAFVFFGLLFVGVFSGTLSQYSFGLGGMVLVCATRHMYDRQLRQAILLKAVRVEQERELVVQKELGEQLLHNILPRSVALMLAAEPGCNTARFFPSITALTMDVVSFTLMSSEMNALAVVAMLNSLFSKFDTLVKALNVEKICTIGDAYVAASGLPDPCLDHAMRMCMLGVGMLNVASKVKAYSSGSRDGEEKRPVGLGPPQGRPISIRVGIHTGSCVAGILGGKIRFKYDIYGDAMHVAGALEQSGVPMALHVSKATLDQIDTHELVRRHRAMIEPRDNPLHVHVSGVDELLDTYILRFPDIAGERPAEDKSGKPTLSRLSTKLSMRGHPDTSPLLERHEIAPSSQIINLDDEVNALLGDRSTNDLSG